MQVSSPTLCETLQWLLQIILHRHLSIFCLSLPQKVWRHHRNSFGFWLPNEDAILLLAPKMKYIHNLWWTMICLEGPARSDRSIQDVHPASFTISGFDSCLSVPERPQTLLLSLCSYISSLLAGPLLLNPLSSLLVSPLLILNVSALMCPPGNFSWLNTPFFTKFFLCCRWHNYTYIFM